ncbi:hypothetical protein SNEBB_008404 [Seison nebaliae]|nr:hypothetical protein SNEBB_008404 [Seison nebaliae]
MKLTEQLEKDDELKYLRDYMKSSIHLLNQTNNNNKRKNNWRLSKENRLWKLNCFRLDISDNDDDDDEYDDNDNDDDDEHLNEIESRIYLGDEIAATSRRTLSFYKITHIINCCAGYGMNQVHTGRSFYVDYKNIIDYYGINAIDQPFYQIHEHFEMTSNYIKEVLRKSKKYRILIHCHKGISRSSTIVLAHLMINNRWKLLTAIDHVKRRRFIYPNIGFLSQLLHLARQLDLAFDVNEMK